ncbi:MAG: hypothetical protein ABI140_09425, partial [Jatrophihabitantaceae bacterium]
RTCKFPGCEKVVVQPAGAQGRPVEYCEDFEHTAVKAWRVKNAGKAAEVQPDDLGRPVTMAATRAGMIRDELVRTAEQLIAQFSGVVHELRTLTDPEAASAQVESMAAEAAQQVAAADLARTQAEAATRRAQADLEEANAAAAELDRQLQEANSARTVTDGQLREALAGLAAGQDALQAAQVELATVTGERDRLQAQQAAQADELIQLHTQLELVTAQAAAAAVAAEAQRREAQRSIDQLDTRLAAATDRASGLDRQLTTARAELDTAHSTQARLDAQLAAALQRAEEANSRTDKADTARAEAERLRLEAVRHATRLEVHLEQAREQLTTLAGAQDQPDTGPMAPARRGRGTRKPGSSATPPPAN